MHDEQRDRIDRMHPLSQSLLNQLSQELSEPIAQLPQVAGGLAVDAVHFAQGDVHDLEGRRIALLSHASRIGAILDGYRGLADAAEVRESLKSQPNGDRLATLFDGVVEYHYTGDPVPLVKAALSYLY